MSILNATDADKAIIPPDPTHTLQLFKPDAAGQPAGRTTLAALTASAMAAITGQAPAALATLAAIDAQIAADEGSAAALTALVGTHTAALAAQSAKLALAPNPVTTIAASGASQALAYPASGNAAYDITLTADCALSLSGGTPGQLQTLTLILRQDATAGHAPALPSGVKWPGSTPPAPNTAAGGIDVFTFTTPDARATVLGSY